MKEINREYWIKQAGADNIQLVDEIVKIINSSAKHHYECNYNKMFIGLMDGDHPYNFVTIVPQKKQCQVAIRLAQQDNTDGVISGAFPDMKYKDGWYFIKVSQDTISKLGDLKGVLQQAEAGLRKDGAQSDVATEPVEAKSSGPKLVDLGLSVKWANCNLGASKPEEYGTYFAWGDVKGQTWDGSKWSGGGFRDFPKYELDSNNNLKPEYDAAHVILGGSYRMPTKDECQELIDNCEIVWTDDYQGTGVAGRVFTSKKNGNAIFLPAAGYGGDSYLDDRGSDGNYWSSTFGGGIYAWYLYFYSNNVYTDYGYHGGGFSVRPVTE